MGLNNIKKLQKNHGFTIVELLVVIVVIGILASITIVSYTGITQRANTTSAQSAAANVLSKAEVYNADGPTNVYPASLSLMTTAATTTTYYLSGVTFSGTLLAAAPAKPNVINYFRCGHTGSVTAVTTLASITNITGARVGYWDYTNKAIAYTNIGNISTSVGTYPVSCVITTVE